MIQLHSGFSFCRAVGISIIPLCSNELRILDPCQWCSIREIPAPFDVIRYALLYRRYAKPEIGERTVLIANFRVVLRYFRVNSVDKSYRKAINIYLTKNNSK